MSNKEKAYKTIRLQIVSGKAAPSSSIGPALGQHGINIMNFCKEFNQRTANNEELPVTAVITVYPNKTFKFTLKQPPTSTLIKKVLGLKLTKKPGSGSKNPGTQVAGSITDTQLREIAKIKENDLNSYSIDEAIKIIAGTAKSMGIDVKDL